MIAAAFFDLDDTLCDDSGAWIHCARRASALGAEMLPGVDAEELAQRFLAISELYWTGLAYTTETRSLHELRTSQFREAIAAVGAAVDENAAEAMAQLYASIRSTEISLFPDVLTTLAALRRRGVKLACITNGLQSTHVEKVARLGLNIAFDHILIAELVGHFKPDGRIFERALHLCGCSPHEAIMVGDDLHNDIRGAQEVGIKAYWYNPKARRLAPGDPHPDGEVRALADVLDIPNLFD